MKTFRLLTFAAALLGVAGTVSAQPGPGAGPGSGASAPLGGPGGMGRMGGPGHMGGRWGTDFTAGWSMMTPAERQEHQAKMRSMTNYDECKAYMDQHHQQMAERAKGKGRTVPAQPGRDACAGLKR
jgi:hypothetical protein